MTPLVVKHLTGNELQRHLDAVRTIVPEGERSSLLQDPTWLLVLRDGLKFEPMCLLAEEAGTLVGRLPLALVQSSFFGRYLVSLPRLSSHSLWTERNDVASLLIDHAIAEAERLRVRFLELRHAKLIAHPLLTLAVTDKVHMRLGLAATVEEQWDRLDSRVRNQIRKSQKQGLFHHWGGTELLQQFYPIYTRRMAELGAPADPESFLRAILTYFSGQASLCVVSSREGPVAGALVFNRDDASILYRMAALTSHRSAAVGSLVHWRVIEEAIRNGSSFLDLGRVTLNSTSYIFKRKWGAESRPCYWQHYLRSGSPDQFRRKNRGVACLQWAWKQLPVSVTRWLGPFFSRGLP